MKNWEMMWKKILRQLLRKKDNNKQLSLAHIIQKSIPDELYYLKVKDRKFPGGLVVRVWCFHHCAHMKPLHVAAIKKVKDK